VSFNYLWIIFSWSILSRRSAFYIVDTYVLHFLFFWGKKHQFTTTEISLYNNLTKKTILLLFVFRYNYKRLSYFPICYGNTRPHASNPYWDHRTVHLYSAHILVYLLPIVYKIFEKLLLKRLLNIVEENNILLADSPIFGFQGVHSTIIHQVR